jgi:hypothetical protein
MEEIQWVDVVLPADSILGVQRKSHTILISSSWTNFIDGQSILHGQCRIQIDCSQKPMFFPLISQTLLNPYNVLLLGRNAIPGHSLVCARHLER